MNADTVWSFLSGVLVIAILVVLVRPGSAATTAINDIGGALTNLVRASVQ